MNSITCSCFLALLLGFTSILVQVSEGSQTTDLNQIIKAIQASISVLAHTCANHHAQINKLNAQLQALTAKEAADVSALNGRITAATEQISLIAGQVMNNSAAIATTNEAISGLMTSLDALSGRVDKLEAVNKIWRANFQVVNVTFAELRKKLKIVVPHIKFPVFVVGG